MVLNKEIFRDSDGLIQWSKYAEALRRQNQNMQCAIDTLEKENENLKKQIGESKHNGKVQKVLKEYCQCIKECSTIKGTENDACDDCTFEDNCYVGKTIFSLFDTDEEMDEFVKQFAEKLECGSDDKLEQAFHKACYHISKYEEPLCLSDECNEEFESCTRCGHSVCTIKEWKEYFLKEIENE